jgi:hypothetical protein
LAAGLAGVFAAAAFVGAVFAAGLAAVTVRGLRAGLRVSSMQQLLSKAARRKLRPAPPVNLDLDYDILARSCGALRHSLIGRRHLRINACVEFATPSGAARDRRSRR